MRSFGKRRRANSCVCPRPEAARTACHSKLSVNRSRSRCATWSEVAKWEASTIAQAAKTSTKDSHNSPDTIAEAEERLLLGASSFVFILEREREREREEKRREEKRRELY